MSDKSEGAIAKVIGETLDAATMAAAQDILNWLQWKSWGQERKHFDITLEEARLIVSASPLYGEDDE